MRFRAFALSIPLGLASCAGHLRVELEPRYIADDPASSCDALWRRAANEGWSTRLDTGAVRWERVVAAEELWVVEASVVRESRLYGYRLGKRRVDAIELELHCEPELVPRPVPARTCRVGRHAFVVVDPTGLSAEHPSFAPGRRCTWSFAASYGGDKMLRGSESVHVRDSLRPYLEGTR